MVGRPESPSAANSPIRIVSCLWYRFDFRACQPAFSRPRYSAGATGTVEPSIACGPRSSPKLGSFQIDQKLTRGSGLDWPGGVKWPS